MASFLSGEFLLRMPCWLHFYLGSLCPMLDLLFCGEFLLHLPCWLHFYVGSFSYTSCAAFIFTGKEFLLHDACWVRVLFLFCLFVCLFVLLLLFSSGKFLLHIPCWFIFITGGDSLTHPVLASFLSEVFLTHPKLASFFLSGDCLLHIQ